MLKVYVNPKCSKSRKLLDVLDEQSIDYEEIYYLETKLSLKEILGLAKAAKTKVKNLIRTKESVYSDLTLAWDDDELAAKAIINHPILLERPIAFVNDLALVIRSDEAIDELLINCKKFKKK